MEHEDDNLRAALRWLLDQADAGARNEREAGLRLAGALGYFWYARGYHAEGRSWLEEALARTPIGEGVVLAVRTRALVRAGRLVAMQGELEQASALLAEGLALAQQRHDRSAQVECLIVFGFQTILAGRAEEGIQPLHDAHTLARALGQGHFLGEVCSLLGTIAFHRGDCEEGGMFIREAIKHFIAVDDARDASCERFGLAVVERALGDLARAVRRVCEGLQAGIRLQDRHLLSLGVSTTLLFVTDHAAPDQVARLLGAQDMLAQSTVVDLSKWERVTPHHPVPRFRERLAHQDVRAAYREGRSLSFSDIATLVLTLLEECAQAFAPPASIPVPDTAW